MQNTTWQKAHFLFYLPPPLQPYPDVVEEPFRGRPHVTRNLLGSYILNSNRYRRIADIYNSIMPVAGIHIVVVDNALDDLVALVHIQVMHLPSKVHVNSIPRKQLPKAGLRATHPRYIPVRKLTRVLLLCVLQDRGVAKHEDTRYARVLVCGC